jgi:predicted hydrocarbon binding protein
MRDESEKENESSDSALTDISHITLPQDAIRTLRLELENLVGEKIASGVLFRFGYKCGEPLSEFERPSDLEEKELQDVLKKFWKRTGLGAIVKVELVSDEETIVVLENSKEALSMGESQEPICDFTRGYLAGMLSRLSGEKHHCVESECIASGVENCKFHLVVFPHRIYIPKGSKGA